MTILRDRVHLNWEVFNWHGYLGYSYIRIAHPISQEFPKNSALCFLRLRRAHGRRPSTLQLSFVLSRSRGSLYREIGGCCGLRHPNLLLTQPPERRLGACCPVIVFSGLTVSPWQQQPLGQWTAGRLPTSVLLLFSSWGEFDEAGNHQTSAFSKDASLFSY